MKQTQVRKKQTRSRVHDTSCHKKFLMSELLARSLTCGANATNGWTIFSEWTEEDTIRLRRSSFLSRSEHIFKQLPAATPKALKKECQAVMKLSNNTVDGNCESWWILDCYAAQKHSWTVEPLSRRHVAICLKKQSCLPWWNFHKRCFLHQGVHDNSCLTIGQLSVS